MNIEEIIKEALEIDCAICYPIEDFELDELIELSEKAKKSGLIVILRAEHSNLHQGVLVEVFQKNSEVIEKIIM